VIVEQQRDQRMRVGVGLVDLRQLDERGAIPDGLCVPVQRIAIALPFVDRLNAAAAD